MSKESDGGNVDYANYGKEGNGLEVQPFWGKAIFDTSTKERRFLGIDGALYAESPWDCVWLNGKCLPGIWKATATPAIQLERVQRCHIGGTRIRSGWDHAYR
jgi:hypothetical protein